VISHVEFTVSQLEVKSSSSVPVYVQFKLYLAMLRVVLFRDSFLYVSIDIFQWI